MSIYSSNKLRRQYTLFLVFALCFGSVHAQGAGEVYMHGLKPNGGVGFKDTSVNISGSSLIEIGPDYMIRAKKDGGVSLSEMQESLIRQSMGLRYAPISDGSNCNNNALGGLYNNFAFEMLQKDWSNFSCTGVTKHSSCEVITSCVESGNLDMRTIFADRQANQILAGIYMKKQLSLLYPKIMSFDAMALYAKNKYQIQYPADFSKEARKGCYYGLELAVDSPSFCNADMFTKQVGKFINSCNSNGSECKTDLPNTEKLSLNDFSKKIRNHVSGSFEMDYLLDQRTQLAEHFSRAEEELTKKLYALLTSPEFQKQTPKNKIIEIQKYSKDDPVLNYLFSSDFSKMKGEVLLQNKELMGFINSKPSSHEDFVKKFDSYKISEINDIMQMDRINTGKCEINDNVTTICARGTVIANGGVLSDPSYNDKAFMLTDAEKEGAFQDLLSMLDIESASERKKIEDYGLLFLSSRACKATGLVRQSENDKKINFARSNVDVGDIYNMSAENSQNSISSWGSDDHSSLDLSRMGGYESDSAIQKRKDESLAEFAKEYSSEPSGGAVDYNANALPYNQAISPSYIPSVVRAQDFRGENQSSESSQTGGLPSDSAVIAAGRNSSVGIAGAPGEDLKLAKEQLAKSQQELKAIKDQMEKDKFASLESELLKKQKELDKLTSKVADLEKAQQAPAAVAKVEKAVVKPTSFSSSMPNLGSGSSVVSKGESSSSKFDSKPSGSSSTSSKSSDSSRSPAAILSSSSSERLSSGASGPVMKVDGMSNKDVTESIKKKITELKGGSFFIEENGIIKEIVVETKDGKIVLDENGNPVYKEVEVGKAGDKLLALPTDKAKTQKVKTAADLKKLDENAVKTNNNRGAFYKNLIKETKKVIKSEQ